jgi:hypothetical protein
MLSGLKRKSLPKKPVAFKHEHLAFVKMRRDDLEYWTKAKKSEYFTFRPVETTYVSIWDLNQKAENPDGELCDFFPPGIWAGCPGFMCSSWVNEDHRRHTKEYNYKFGTGSYTSTTNLLLVDDLFDWVHGRRQTTDIRSAFDIIKAIHDGEMILE